MPNDDGPNTPSYQVLRYPDLTAYKTGTSYSQAVNEENAQCSLDEM